MAVLKTVVLHGTVGSNPTSSAKQNGEVTELAEGARLLSECMGKLVPRVRISPSPPVAKEMGKQSLGFEFPFFCFGTGVTLYRGGHRRESFIFALPGLLNKQIIPAAFLEFFQA